MENHGQKRTASEQQDIFDGIKVILLDIEGTTTPISFVKDKLFPYVRENLKSYIEGHFDEDELKEDITALRELAGKDKEEGLEGLVEIPDLTDSNKDDVVDALVKNITAQMDTDRKTTALKQLQGHMWREAYKTGEVAGEVFEDVMPCIQDWLAQDLRVCIYSSGSVEAQKLLFTYSDKGDLSKLLSGYFDTTVGSKVDKASYTAIAGELGVETTEVLFLTDMPKEATAAVEAGCRASLVVREGNGPLSEEDLQRFNVVATFDELACDLDEEEFPPCKELRGEENGEDDDDDDDVDDEDEEVDEDEDVGGGEDA